MLLYLEKLNNRKYQNINPSGEFNIVPTTRFNHRLGHLSWVRRNKADKSILSYSYALDINTNHYINLECDWLLETPKVVLDIYQKTYTKGFGILKKDLRVSSSAYVLRENQTIQLLRDIDKIVLPSRYVDESSGKIISDEVRQNAIDGLKFFTKLTKEEYDGFKKDIEEAWSFNNIDLAMNKARLANMK